MSVLTPLQVRRLARALERRSQGAVRLPDVPIETNVAVRLWRDCVVAFGTGTEVEGKVRLLSADELQLLRQRAWRRSRGHANLPSERVTLAEGLAFWRLVGTLGALAKARQSDTLSRAARIAALGLAASQLAACTGLLGGNVKGSFACSAPGGSCAPSTLIDDQALSVIQNARPMSPAGPYFQPPARATQQSALRVPAGEGRLAAATPGMVHRERRVLRVVFPSYVDGAGNFHEPRVVHTIADQGGWMALTSGERGAAEAIAGRKALGARDPSASSEGPGRVDPAQQLAGAGSEVASTAPPDPRAVAEARARGLARPPGTAPVNPLDTIRAQVAATLAGPPKGAAAQPVPAGQQPVEPAKPVPAQEELAKPAAAVAPGAAPVVANPPAAFSPRIEE